MATGERRTRVTGESMKVRRKTTLRQLDLRRMSNTRLEKRQDNCSSTCELLRKITHKQANFFQF